MATLVRHRTEEEQDQVEDVSSGVPSPFPVDHLNHWQHQKPAQQVATPPIDTIRDSQTTREANEDLQTLEQPEEQQQVVENTDALHDLIPSIAGVQRSCLMTLNDLLQAGSPYSFWSSIGAPDRRHSVPVHAPTQSSADSPSSVLQALLTNLRERDQAGGGDVMVERPIADSQDETGLIKELGARVSGLTDTLTEDDAQLAQSIVTLLSYFRRLSVILASSPQSAKIATSSTLPRGDADQSLSTMDSFATLKRELSDFQIARSVEQDEQSSSGVTPVLAVESTLLWSRIDEQLEIIVALSKNRALAHRPSFDSASILPPHYDDWEYEVEVPPQYEYPPSLYSIDDKKTSPTHSTFTHSTVERTNEKMRMDLEAVTMAIDRLYLVAPQLHNQRVELKSSKVLQMEKARSAGASISTTPKVEEGDRKGKQKAVEDGGPMSDPREMERLFEMINRASERKMTDQTVVLKGGMRGQLEKSQVRDREKRDAFVEKLALHSDAGRYHGQDATLQPNGTRMKDPEALLTLLEFSRETVPAGHLHEILKHDEAVLSLPEFIKESASDPYIDGSLSSSSSFSKTSSSDVATSPPASGSRMTHARKKSVPKEALKEKGRSRSLSAPSLNWLRPSASRSSGLRAKIEPNDEVQATASGLSADPSVISSNSRVLEVHYVAEHHENLHHILIFLSVQGNTPGVEIEVVVLPSLNSAEEGDKMIVRAGLQSSHPLPLPALVAPGKKVVRVQSSHFEVKIPTLRLAPGADPFSDPHPAVSVPIPLFDATHLLNIQPTSFICASCSLPLVQGSKIHTYRDLPSDHWEELVDAWMCHSDIKLNEEIMKKHKEGFWPDDGLGLVGGSYVLCAEDAMVKTNLCVGEKKADQDWNTVRCICGSIIGRSQPHPQQLPSLVFRLVKYAIRPVSAKAEPLKMPLSAFIVEDMNEFVQAHATYRFVILDEEEEKPRLLVWLFKPSMKLAYTTPRSYSIPKSASVQTAKVLYKILKPAPGEPPLDLQTVVNKYPGFPQAEYLYYPIMICRRLAGLMRESTGAYPESMRTMTGLDVGWLARG